jgi:hypothetical protein
MLLARAVKIPLKHHQKTVSKLCYIESMSKFFFSYFYFSSATGGREI